MDKPKITIITPSFNQGEYLEQTITSVLEQGYPNLEYMVVDGGSTDNSVEIIKKYEKYLAWWVSEKDSGQSDAINKGISRMTGSVFNWLNSDDYYSPGVLKEVALSFTEGVSAVSGHINFLYPNNISVLSKPFPEGNDLATIISSTKYLQPSTFYAADFIKQAGGVNSLLHYCMDYELWLKYLLKYGLGGICRNKNVLVNFRIHSSSKTYTQASGFDKEMRWMFFSMLSHLEGSGNLPGHPFNYRFDPHFISGNEKLVKRAASLYFYHSTINAYGARDFKLFDALSPLIELKELDSAGKTTMLRMRKRRALFPAWLFNLWR